MLVLPHQRPPAGGGAGADTGAGGRGEHHVGGAEAGRVTPAGAGLLVEGGHARAGEPWLPALTTTGGVVLHHHHRVLAGEVVLVHNTDSHIPGGSQTVSALDSED